MTHPCTHDQHLVWPCPTMCQLRNQSQRFISLPIRSRLKHAFPPTRNRTLLITHQNPVPYILHRHLPHNRFNTSSLFSCLAFMILSCSLTNSYAFSLFIPHQIQIVKLISFETLGSRHPFPLRFSLATSDASQYVPRQAPTPPPFSQLL